MKTDGRRNKSNISSHLSQKSDMKIKSKFKPKTMKNSRLDANRKEVMMTLDDSEPSGKDDLTKKNSHKESHAEISSSQDKNIKESKKTENLKIGNMGMNERKEPGIEQDQKELMKVKENEEDRENISSKVEEIPNSEIKSEISDKSHLEKEEISKDITQLKDKNKEIKQTTKDNTYKIDKTPSKRNKPQSKNDPKSPNQSHKETNHPNKEPTNTPVQMPKSQSPPTPNSPIKSSIDSPEKSLRSQSEIDKNSNENNDDNNHIEGEDGLEQLEVDESDRNGDEGIFDLGFEDKYVQVCLEGLQGEDRGDTEIAQPKESKGKVIHMDFFRYKNTD